MTTKDIQVRVTEIRKAVDDDERAHGLEDQLHQDVLRAIASGRMFNPAALAAEALKTKTISFARWCA